MNDFQRLLSRSVILSTNQAVCKQLQGQCHQSVEDNNVTSNGDYKLLAINNPYLRSANSTDPNELFLLTTSHYLRLRESQLDTVVLGSSATSECVMVNGGNEQHRDKNKFRDKVTWRGKQRYKINLISTECHNNSSSAKRWRKRRRNKRSQWDGGKQLAGGDDSNGCRPKEATLSSSGGGLAGIRVGVNNHRRNCVKRYHDDDGGNNINTQKRINSKNNTNNNRNNNKCWLRSSSSNKKRVNSGKCRKKVGKVEYLKLASQCYDEGFQWHLNSLAACHRNAVSRITPEDFSSCEAAANCNTASLSDIAKNTKFPRDSDQYLTSIIRTTTDCANQYNILVDTIVDECLVGDFNNLQVSLPKITVMDCSKQPCASSKHRGDD